MSLGLFAGDALMPGATLDFTSGGTAGWVNLGGGGFGIPLQSLAGEKVDPETVMSLSTVFRCITKIAADFALMPRSVMQKTGGARHDKPEHRVHYLVHTRPNPDMTAMNFFESLLANTLGWGHGYARIIRDGDGDPEELRIVHPSRVTPKKDEHGPFYDIYIGPGEHETVRPDDMIDIMGPNGWSPIRYGVQSMGRALAEDRYASTYLSSAVAPSGIFNVPEALTPEQRDTLRKEFKEKFGGAKNVGEVLVTEGGGTFQPLSIKPVDAQLLEGRQYSVEDICRWFGMPPEKVHRQGQARGWQAREQVDIEYLGGCLMPWVVRAKEEFAAKLFTRDEIEAGYYLHINHKVLLRADIKTQEEAFDRAFRSGALTINERRALGDLNPIGPAGNISYMLMNMAPVEDIASGKARKNAPVANSADKGGPGGEANDDPDKGDGGKGKDARAHLRPVFEDAALRFCARHEDRRERLLKKYEDDTAGLVAAWAEQMPSMREAFVRMFTPAAHAFGVAEPKDFLANVASRFWDHADAGVAPEPLARSLMVGLEMGRAFESKGPTNDAA